MESLIVLVRYLTALYLIPRDFVPEEKRFLTSKSNMDFKGIVSHVNFRSNGKWDIGPAFNWAALIAGLNLPQFVPTINPIRSTRSRTQTSAESEFIIGKNQGSIYIPGKRTIIRPYDPFDYEQ